MGLILCHTEIRETWDKSLKESNSDHRIQDAKEALCKGQASHMGKEVIRKLTENNQTLAAGIISGFCISEGIDL